MQALDIGTGILYHIKKSLSCKGDIQDEKER